MQSGLIKYLLKIIGPVMALAATPGVCQDQTPEGRFLTDSARTGEIAAYAFSFRYPADMEAVFPDSNYNYYPFEFVRKDFFPTQTTAGIAFDSAVYYLTSFELLNELPLTLPVIVMKDGDSVAYFAESDTLSLKETVTILPDSIALKESTTYREIDTAFNYPYAVFGLLLLVVIAMVGALLFGKQLRRRYRLYRLKKDYEKYIKRISRLVGSINGNASAQAGLAVSEWKRYLETLDNKPLTKLTTREISGIYSDKSVADSLRGIDRALYGSIHDERLKEWLKRLISYSEERYRHKTEEVKHV